MPEGFGFPVRERLWIGYGTRGDRLRGEQVGGSKEDADAERDRR